MCARVRRKYNARCSRRLLGPMNRGGRPRVWRAQSVKCNYAAVAVCFMLLAAYTAGKYRANGVGEVKQKSHTCRRRLFPSPPTYGSRMVRGAGNPRYAVAADYYRLYA